MNQECKKSKGILSNSANSDGSSHRHLSFPDEVLEKVLSLIDSHKDRSSISLVCKDWYNAERWTRSSLFIGNCYSVSPEIVAKRFPRIKRVKLKGKPRFSDFNMLPPDWGANVHSWLVMFSKVYPFLEELWLKRMTINDESLHLIASSFPQFKSLYLASCEGFTDDGLKAITSHCRNLVELNIKDNITEGVGGGWLSCFPDDFTSLEVLNFASINCEVSFDALERLVSRCRSLRVLRVNESITLNQLQRLLVHAPQLMELGTGSFWQPLTPRQYKETKSVFSKCKNLQSLSGLWHATALCLHVLYGACANLTFLNLSDAFLKSDELANLLSHCPNLRRLWVIDTVEDKGLEAVGSYCPLLEELRVFPLDPYDLDYYLGVTEQGFMAVSRGCPKLHYVLYFCRRMTNAAVATIVQNCPDFTHFRLCIMNPREPDYLTNDPMDEAFAAVVRTCTKLRRLSVSGLLTDWAFECIGTYAKNLETLSVAFAGNSDKGMQYVLQGCPKLRKLEIRDCPFGDAALLSGIEKYERMRSLWMSTCDVTMDGCKMLAKQKPRLNVEAIKDENNNGSLPDKVYVYRSVAGPRKDIPSSVLTL
ncbi:transport inhibitor response 1-like protein Os04g0395600 [Andrographis paniculata]|uniref:transport inhibitor response 1-like protein Os04g0395600 n=1 Tax=Andrographis paniculata TaxID=175694 RepID=UPI0021E9908F|nr:transport inhibitor response 1-like protein Os04g0395600 [Andrographis paniculata]XP_051133834.1 transport inhibitor response 1-like protein Os04g0395600 [Andrographis paniculata]XP_051133835.1 transport inhibitor response 1-like protein Os04g0395600 [Andrographis paniculata]XP_051133836.1 transport inhibitor response 1-like protein Os04g0395600 [Andrographis paniculata]XP_051133837.1 transport inhibitor response 1-like protein Os04g0395600 [Andrographis paniculata]XP_051133838.1 transport 